MAIQSSRLRDIIIGIILILVGGVTLVHTLHIFPLDQYERNIIEWSVYCLAGLGVLLLIFYLIKPANLWLLIVALCLLFIAAVIYVLNFQAGREELIGIALFLLTALAFFSVFIVDRTQWWAMLVAWICIGLAGTIWISMERFTIAALPALEWDTLAPLSFLGGAAVGFLFVWLFAPRKRWWAFMTAGLIVAVCSAIVAKDIDVREEFAGIWLLLIAGVVFLLLWLMRNEENKLSWAVYPAAVLLPLSAFLYLILFDQLRPQLVLSIIFFVLGIFFVGSYFFSRRKVTAEEPRPQYQSPTPPAFPPPPTPLEEVSEPEATELREPPAFAEEPAAEAVEAEAEEPPAEEEPPEAEIVIEEETSLEELEEELKELEEDEEGEEKKEE